MTTTISTWGRRLAGGGAVLALAGCGLLGGSTYENSREIFEELRETGSCEPEQEGSYEELAEGEEEGLPALNAMYVECYGETPDVAIPMLVAVPAEDMSGEELAAALVTSEDGVDDWAYTITGGNWVILVGMERDLNTETLAKTTAEELGGELGDTSS